MSFKENLVKARSGIIFILALSAGTGLIFWLENLELTSTEGIYAVDPFPQEISVELAVHRSLTQEELAWAKTAWQYFENNLQTETGLVNSVAQFPATTMWDTASYLMALIAADRLKLIDRPTFDQRLDLCLKTLANLPLFEDQLPNKSYNTITAAMVDYENNPAPQGIGWSAIDIGRIMVPIQVIVWTYPQHLEQVRAILNRWDFSAMISDGILFGALRQNQNPWILVQEGRLGYEEYAAKALQLAGLHVREAAEIRDFLSFERTYGVDVAIDTRSPEVYEARNYVVSEPYLLSGIEFGWDTWDAALASRVYLAQKGRFEATGTLTAVSEDHIDQAPFFVYNTVYSDGKLWSCITEKGEVVDDLKTLSTKAAFGWHALLGSDYTEKLIEEASALAVAEKGFYAGLYEKTQQPNKSLSANTNAIILESLCYIQYGPFLKITGGSSP